MVWASIALVSFLVAAFLFAALVKPASAVGFIGAAYIFWGGSVLVVGYMLAGLDQLARVELWALCGCVLGASVVILSKTFRGHWFPRRTDLPSVSLMDWREEWHRAGRICRLTIELLATTWVITGSVSLLLAVLLPPAHWDSLAYHLARMAYYLQFGNLSVFFADYYPQVVFAKGSTVLLIWTYLATGQTENLLSLLQFSSYLLSILVAFGVARKLNISRLAALAGALLFGLFINVLLEATTTQNDLLLAAFIAIGIYFLYCFGGPGQRRDLVLAVAAFSIGVAIKNTFVLFVPSVLVIAVVMMRRADFPARTVLKRDICIILVSAVLFGAIVLPAGYWDNWKMFGNALGPADIFALESTEDEALQGQLVGGIKNSLRTGLDLISLDGLPMTDAVVQTQAIARAPFVLAVQAIAPDLETQPELGASYQQGNPRAFTFLHLPRTHPDESFWGIAGFALVIPLVLIVALGLTGPRDLRLMAFAALAAFVVLCFALDYESWHGRRLVATAWFCAPCTAWLFQRLWNNTTLRISLWPRLVNGYVVVIVGVACFCALSTLVFAKNSALYPRDPASLWAVGKFMFDSGRLESDRLALMMRSRSEYLDAVRSFEREVPPDAVVATYLSPNSFEYPLFGQRLTRTILPLNSFIDGPQPIPANAQFLLYARGLGVAATGDEPLGADWYLRRLK